MKKISLYLNIVLIVIIVLLVEIFPFKSNVHLQQQIYYYYNYLDKKFIKLREWDHHVYKIFQQNRFLNWRKCGYYAELYSVFIFKTYHL